MTAPKYNPSKDEKETTVEVEGTKKKAKRRLSRCQIFCIVTAVLVVILGFAFGGMILHSLKRAYYNLKGFCGTTELEDNACAIKWKFESTCDTANKKIVQQILEWKEPNENASRWFSYELISNNSKEIKARYDNEDLVFTFHQEKPSCLIEGSSFSSSWYYPSVRHQYCTLKKLITGAGICKLSGFKETIDESQCPGYINSECRDAPVAMP